MEDEPSGIDALGVDMCRPQEGDETNAKSWCWGWGGRWIGECGGGRSHAGRGRVIDIGTARRLVVVHVGREVTGVAQGILLTESC